MEFQSVQLSWTDISINKEDLCLSLGQGYVLEGDAATIFSSLERKVAGLCKPCFGYRTFDAEPMDKSCIMLEGHQLRTGHIIAPYLEKADKYALFVATAGREFEEFQKETGKEGLIVEEFLLDALGTAIAEATVREACRRIETMFKEIGMGISFPYSPGYCGWKVTDQQELFSLLPEYPCGISLSSSSLMSPIKSVSGIIAIGKLITKQKYGCELCRKADCYKNRNKREKHEYR